MARSRTIGLVATAAVAVGVLGTACEPAASPPAPASAGVATVAGKAVESGYSSVTPDGRYVAFASSAPLVPGFVPAGGGGIYLARRHIYRLDRQTGTIVPVSVSSDGGPLKLDHGVAAPMESSMSDDGRYIAFTTIDPDVVPHDTHMTQPPSPETLQDVFVRDVVAGTTTRIELPGGVDLNAPSGSPQISGNGRWVTFATLASNIDPADTNRLTDVYRWDRTTGALARISTAAGGGAADKASLRAIPFNDGNVVFESRATNLGSGFTVPNNQVYTYVRNMTTGTLELVSVSSSGAPIEGVLRDASASGARILFDSTMKGVPDDTAGSTVYLRDRTTSTTSAAMRTATGAVFPSSPATISANGRYIVMPSRNTGIVPGDVDGATMDDLFVRDLATNKKYQVNRSANGTPGTTVTTKGFGISDDGRTVVFGSTSHAYAADDGTIIERAFVQRTPLP